MTISKKDIIAVIVFLLMIIVYTLGLYQSSTIYYGNIAFSKPHFLHLCLCVAIGLIPSLTTTSSSEESIFYKYSNEFDYLFTHDDSNIVLDFEQVFKIYEKSDYEIENIQIAINDLIDLKENQ